MLKINNYLVVATYSLIIIISIFYLIRGINSSHHGTSYPFDLTPSLVGTKNLIISGIDPYSRDGQKLIEIAYFGRELNESDLLMRQRFFYPLYIIFIYYPFIYLDMAYAVFIIYIISFILFVITIILWSKAITGLNNLLSATVLIYFLMSPITYHAIDTRQPFIIMFFLLTISIYLLLYKSSKLYFFLAGMLLFLSTVRPQNALIAIGYIFIVLLPNLKGRKLRLSVFLGFILMGFISLIITNVLIPGWISEFVHSLSEYRSYAEAGNGAEKLFGKGVISLVFELLSGLIGLFMIIICFKTNKRFLHITCFSYLISLQGLIFPSYSYVILMGIPIIALSVKQAVLMWEKAQNIKLLIIAFNVFLIFYMMVGYWLLDLSNSEKYGNIIKNYFDMRIFPMRTPFMILPLVLGLGVMLFVITYKSKTNNIYNVEIIKLNN
jgi:hypothetical protein